MGTRQPDLFAELFRVIPRDEHAWSGKPDSDSLHRIRILSLVHAWYWAQAVGIRFKWQLESGGWCCRATLNDVELIRENGWFESRSPTEGHAGDKATAAWCEADMARCMMFTFSLETGSDETDNSVFVETAPGRIEYTPVQELLHGQ